MVKLRMEYKNVVLIKSSTKGLEYLQENLSAKNIVLLDYDFGNEPNGVWLLNEIRKLTNLLQIIVLTEIPEKITNDEFAQLIDKHAFTYIERRKDYNLILSKVKEAENSLNSSVLAALEKWAEIEKKRNKNPDKPYMVVASSGKSYTFDALMREIRQQSPMGRQFETDLNRLTIDLLLQNEIQWK